MIGWAIDTLIASTILMLVVLVLRGPVARYFGPHIAYGLWLLPALRMILPPLPEEVAPVPLHILPSPIDLEFLLAAPMVGATAAEPLIDWPVLLAALWALGAVAFLGWHVLSYRRFVQSALADATQLPRFDREGVEVCASPSAPGPFAAGIFMKKIVLPADYRRRYHRDELRLALEHEVQHHRRCDMSANFAGLVVLALHWWNPIAYFAHRAFRIDQELACDAMVLARATPDERHAYGVALLKSACDRLPVAACALGAGDDLKKRLRMMKTYRWNPARARAGGLIAACLVGSGLMLTASNGIAAETSAKVEEQVRTALAPVVPAMAPEPSALPLAPPAAAAPVNLAMAPSAPQPPAPPAPPSFVANTDAIHSLVQIDTAGIARHAGLAAAAAASAAGSWIDQAELSREISEEVRRELDEARREAAQDRAEALREASEARQEALREAAEARREGEQARREAEQARREGETARAHGTRARIAFHSDSREHCGSRGAHVNIDSRGHRAASCPGWSDREQAQFRRNMLDSLRSARASIASMDRRHMPVEAREQALVSLDRQIERLRTGK